ncbi:MAG TPA: hypothetical protein VFA07_05495 [Chthonomonadaceae bacterium]|nr:hypothetical protein [Chthonomonadaceae bacterium]
MQRDYKAYLESHTEEACATFLAQLLAYEAEHGPVRPAWRWARQRRKMTRAQEMAYIKRLLINHGRLRE